ncbi:MAG TPA: L-serine ammonia-lyase, iron-sulfur-dependent subunit beta, partial [Anaerolineaceae bacterium]|nr:L-serine ammonia-lyase, iron-sulfur-dependent subunit beta [Anaerolineaceae bacterium]
MSNNSLFDVIGPIMVGPSSSHTAGAAKLGRLARQLVHGDIVEVRFTLYDSFARTYRGHGTGKALLGGVMGYDLDSEELKHAETIATFRGLKFSFEEGHKDGIHPNSVDIHLTEDNGKKTSLSGSSIGGGNVVITSINGIETRLQTNLPAIVTHHRDRV